MTSLDFDLTRDIVIRAQRETVFRYFTDSERWARWWGEGSTIDPRPDGPVLICFPGNVVVRGAVVELVPGERIVFTYGFESGDPIPVGASRVTIRLSEEPEGTRVSLLHALPDAASRAAHVLGWRYQLAVFANIVAEEAHAGIDERTDRFFAAWAAADADRRRAALEATTTKDITFRDRFGCVHGRDELDAHIAAMQTHMPGIQLTRQGQVRQCQGTALVDWQAAAEDGTPRGQGSDVFELAADGRIHRAVGFWSMSGC